VAEIHLRDVWYVAPLSGLIDASGSPLSRASK
jgi:hypothetical protein